MKLIKAIARGTVRKVKEWVREPPKDPIETEGQRFRVSAYGQLNRTLLQLHREKGDILRPHFTWGVLHAAHLARALGYKTISVIEFGVAGGNGLVSLEATASEVERVLGIGFEVYGFDTGVGLPKPQDYRDLPNIFMPSAFKMDPEALKKRLHRTELILGDIGETLSAFLKKSPAPVGFASIDVDLYTSTVQTLKLFEADQKLLLPRVHCYFDDIIGYTYADFNGERLAIKEFNDAHAQRKFSPIYGLTHYVPLPFAHDLWPEKMFLAHVLDHDRYCDDDGLVNQTAAQTNFSLNSPGPRS